MQVNIHDLELLVIAGSEISATNYLQSKGFKYIESIDKEWYVFKNNTDNSTLKLHCYKNALGECIYSSNSENFFTYELNSALSSGYYLVSENQTEGIYKVWGQACRPVPARQRPSLLPKRRMPGRCAPAGGTFPRPPSWRWS